MILYGRPIFVYDIEVFPNVFLCALKNSESGGKRCYEISDRRNDLPEIAKLFTNRKIIFCGYNNHHYDDAIIAYILMRYEILIQKPVWELTKDLKELSDTIINSPDGDTEKWKTYKYAHLFPSMDLLTMLFSSKLRVGLKELQVTMEYHNVQEYEGDFNSFLPVSEIDKAITYNFNDVDSTCELLERCKKAIDLRIGIQKEYGVEVMSKDGVSIGKEILKTKYLQETGKTWAEIKDLRSPCKSIPLNEVIIPDIEYETPILQDLLKEMKELVVDPEEGWGKTFDFFGTTISMSVGGVHSVNKPEIVIPKEDECLIDWDFASLYPSLLIEWEFYPQHLGKEFLTTYSKIKKERIEAKHNGDKIKNETLKLALNSV